MSQLLTQSTTTWEKWSERTKSYYQLTKPKVVGLMLVTALLGIGLAPEPFSMMKAMSALFGIGFMAASAAALNHLIDRNIDAKMSRTHQRPLPKGDLRPKHVFVFATVLGGMGFVVLWLAVNTLTAWLTLASLLAYAVVYTLYLKRATPQNIVIAGIAGAMPPLLGWTSMTGSLHPYPWLLVMIIFIWTPPHFWALAIYRCEEYSKVNVPMLPVTHGVDYTKTSIFLYTILLTLVCVLPYLVGMFGEVYLFLSLLLNTLFIQSALKLKRTQRRVMTPEEQSGECLEKRSALATFKFSIWHLLLLFIAMFLDLWTFGS